MAICRECSAHALVDALFCSHCGSSMPTQPAVLNVEPARLAPTPFASESQEDDSPERQFIGKKYDYYRLKWDMAAVKKNHSSWNWAAFFLGLIWVTYRKMYRYGWILTGVYAVEVWLENLFEFPAGVSRAINFGLAGMLGMMGNRLYETHVAGSVGKIVSEYPPSLAPVELKRQGGTSLFAPLGFLAVFFVLVVVVVAVTGK